MGEAMAMEAEALGAAAMLLRESLQQSQTVTKSMISTLGSFQHRLSRLDNVMHPIQVRAQSYQKVHRNIENTLEAAQAIVNQFDVLDQLEIRILKGPREDFNGYISAVDELKESIQFFSNDRTKFKDEDGALVRAQALLSKAMEKLDGQMKTLLYRHSKILDPLKLSEPFPDDPLELTSEAVLPVLVPPAIVSQLHDIAKRMVEFGLHQQCMKNYKDVRASVLKQTLKFEKISREDVEKLKWEVLSGKIEQWNLLMRVAVKVLLPAEWKLCNEVFDGLDPYREACFINVTQSRFKMFIGIGDSIASSTKYPEKLFSLLNMFETMHDSLPKIKAMFVGDEGFIVRKVAFALKQKLAQGSQDTFDSFPDAVEKNSSKTSVLDGNVHPLTSYVVNYIKFLSDYRTTLRRLFEEDTESDILTSRLATTTSKIMDVLEKNLEGKAEQYQEPALAHIFRMNNIHYIVQHVRSSEFRELLGDDWIPRHRRIVQQHAQAYQRAAWGKVFLCLSSQGLLSSGGSSAKSSGAPGSVDSGSGISRAALKDRFKNFNMFFEELHQKQSQWIVPDVDLREAVRLAIAEVLIPAYRNFLRRYSSILESGKNTQRYIKYTTEDLDRLVRELFDGVVVKKSISS